MCEIVHKTPNILIERNINRDYITKEKQNICEVLEASNIMMASYDDILAESHDVLASSNGKYECTIDRFMYMYEWEIKLNYLW